MLHPPDRMLKKPLQVQLFEQFQELIHSGRLAPLTRLPATRELAAELSVSRTTVLLVYDELIAEGYVQTEPMVGTFVSAHPPNGAPPPIGAVTNGDGRRPPAPLRTGEEADAPTCDFRVDGSDERLFPSKTWRDLSSRVLKAGERDRESDHPAGLAYLRDAVAKWLTAERGIATEAGHILIVSGRLQALQILARLLPDRGQITLVDTPFPHSAAAVFSAAGSRVVPLPADEFALDGRGRESGFQGIALIWLALPRCAAAEVRLSWWKRREFVLDFARREGALLVEYEGANHGTPMAAANRGVPPGLIRLAAFSPTLSRGTRLGYMVMPGELIERATALKAALEDGRSSLEQAVLARFIEEGRYGRHLRRVDKIYRSRRAALTDALRRTFAAPSLEELPDADHVGWVLPPDFPAAAAVQRHALARSVRVDVAEDAVTASDRKRDRILCLGYTRMDEGQITAGVSRLAAALTELCAGRRRSGRSEEAVGAPSEKDFA